MLDIVQDICAAAGLAAGVGLAGLSALHVSHAREVKRLREWAGRAPESSGRDVTAASGRVPSSQRPITNPAVLRTVSEPTAIFASRRSRPWYSRIRTRYVAVALVGLLVLGGALTQLTGNGGGDKSADAKNRNGLTNKRNGAAVEPRNVTVAVLNGTTVPGLAAGLRDQLAAAGFKKGTIDVFPNQQLAESVVQYAPGHEAEAKAVGRRLSISRREPVTADSRALAPDATVIVIAGADKAP